LAWDCLRIFDAMMKNTTQGLVEALGDLVEILEAEFAGVQLPV